MGWGRLQPGDSERIGPYRLIRELGRGGMGRVFLARSAGGRPVAVKVIRPDLAADPEFRARFRHEVSAARKVNGLYTALVVDADVDGPVPWLATAYVAGPSLADKVRLEGPLSVGAVAVLAAGLAEGLGAIHAAGLVHRDLKPSNVLLADDGPRVIDFGISRAAEASSLTSTGLVVGSPGFMSPEQADGREVGPPSDVFSLGAVLTFASTGHGPFGTGSAPALGYRVVHGLPDLDDVPARIRPLVERCLAKDPRERPTVAELLAEFGDPDVPEDWLSPALPGELTPDAPAYPPHAADAPQNDAPAPALAPAWTPTPENRPDPAREVTESRITVVPRAPNVPAASDPGSTGTASAHAGEGQPARLSRRVRPALLALSAVIILAVAGTAAAVLLTSTPSHGSASPSHGSALPSHGSALSSHGSAPPSHGSAGSSAGKFLGCMVTDTGGIDDRSFNALSWQGMQAAAAADSGVTVTYLQSKTQSDYPLKINKFIGEKCNIIVTVGLLMGAATEAAAQAYPNQKFAIVDCSYASGCLTGPQESNIDQLVFNTTQDGFLGGYLAAGMTKTGKVATFGGEDIGTVTIYMDGFWDGVQYYNSKHGTHVTVLGWDEQTQTGSFTGDFTNETEGQTLTQTFMSEGADIIFPVAGNVGLGAANAVQDADQAAGSDKVKMFWVDTDGCVSVAQYCPYFITSVTKGIAATVRNAVLSAAKGTFTGGTYIGTLANGGAVLAPYHDFASKVPAALQAELTQVEMGIENGTISTPTKSPV